MRLTEECSRTGHALAHNEPLDEFDSDLVELTRQFRPSIEIVQLIVPVWSDRRKNHRTDVGRRRHRLGQKIGNMKDGIGIDGAVDRHDRDAAAIVIEENCDGFVTLGSSNELVEQQLGAVWRDDRINMSSRNASRGERAVHVVSLNVDVLGEGVGLLHSTDALQHCCGDRSSIPTHQPIVRSDGR